MEKIKILQITDAFYPAFDGVVSVVDNYAKQLNKKAICKVGAPAPSKKSGYVEKEDYEVIRTTSLRAPEGYRMAMPFLTRKFTKRLDEEKFDIIHIHSPFTMGRIAMHYAKKRNIPVVATLHTKYKEDFKRKLGAKNPLVNFMMRYILKTFNKADSVWTVSDGAKDVLYSYGYKGDVKVFLNATNFEIPENIDELKDVIDQIHGIKGQQNVFLFVGRMAMYKGLRLIARSLKKVKAKTNNFKMIFVGGGFDLPEFKKYVAECGVKDNCIFIESIITQDLLRAYFARADLLIFPSNFDTSGIVKIEAATHKTPSIVIKDSCCADGVVHGENGFLCLDSSNDLSNKLLQIIDGKFDMAKVSENAYNTLHRSWKDAVIEVHDEYVKVINDYKQKNHKNK